MPASDNLSETTLESFVALIAARTGWRFREGHRQATRRAVLARMGALRVKAPDRYYDLLRNESAASRAEWNELTPLLTVGESYFFRDQGQMKLLREQILPDLLQRRKAERTLRLWSAGCSTGEEAYSLAILLDELLAGKPAWGIHILGTDINAQALRKAEEGVFGEWSFRMAAPEVRDRYFTSHRSGWRIASRLREQVSFRCANLNQDRFRDPAGGPEGMDLILCRNVFIYFTPEAAVAVGRKLAATLRDGGYLLTGHAELPPSSLPDLEARTYVESVVYQRRAPLELTKAPPPAPAAPTIERRARPPAPTPAVTPRRLPARRDAPAIAPSLGDDLRSAAEAAANLGRHEAAEEICRQALAADPFALWPLFLLAHLAEEQGEAGAAQELLKKAVYLAPASACGYLELGALFARQRQPGRAQRMWSAAEAILRDLAPDAEVEFCAGGTAGELLVKVRRLLAGNLTT